MGVPPLQNFVGYFLNSPKGRAYLIQVPGSANATLTDQELAEVINWMLYSYAGASLPKQWDLYTQDEVAAYRKAPLTQVTSFRNELLQEIFTHRKN